MQRPASLLVKGYDLLYIAVAIIAFGILIADHEFGHFIAAKLCGVKVNEFAIGMGPAIIKKQGKETLYALRLLPIGGYCAMEGEDEASEDSRAFTSQSWWKRLIILVAGAANNFILGLIIFAVIYSGAVGFYGTTVTSLVDGYKYEETGLHTGDEIYSIEGHRTYYYQDITTYLSRAGDEADIVVVRDGEKLPLSIKKDHYTINGQDSYIFGITGRNVIEATFGEKIKFSCYSAVNVVRMVWMSLGDLFAGRVKVSDMSGVVGIVSTINEVGQESQTTAIAFENIAYLVAFIAVNLAVMNLLPIPALDGGRIFFLLINTIAEKIFKKKINPKYEGYIHAAGMVLLLGLMAFVLVNDVIKIVR